MRREFGKTIYDLARQDSKVNLIIGDTSYKVFPEFLKEFPINLTNLSENRLHNFGTCEQSMVSIATGMALEGIVKPVVYALTPFLLERAFEQVKMLDVQSGQLTKLGLEGPKVMLVGYCDYPDEGPTHALSNERLADVFKNIRSFYPTSAKETREAVMFAYNHSGPSFISLKKDRTLS